jgi:hypothetical protein
VSKVASVKLNEVRLIVNSHLHFVRCGNNFRFLGLLYIVREAV